jgi:hypothetical protein
MHRDLRLVIVCVSCFGIDLSAQQPAQPLTADPGTIPAQLSALENNLRQERALLLEQQKQIVEQQEQIDDLRRQLEQRNAADASGDATAQPSIPEQPGGAHLSYTGLADTGLAATRAAVPSASLAQTEDALQELEHPAFIHYRGITLTPGGFVEAATLFRTRNENADITSNFNSMPFGGVANASLSEFRETARGTRVWMLAEGKAGDIKLSGYVEVDFLGQAPTGNQVQTNSFVPRQRQLFAQAEFENGITLTAGQDWSLITTDRRGIATRAEFIPTTVDGSYVVGMNYVRQTAYRVTKNFDNKFWVAFEVANPETNQPNASYVPPDLFGFNNSANAGSPSGSTLNYLTGSTNGFSTNLAPDLIAKVAFEPGWGHYEIKALGRFFRDRINGNTNIAYGGGVGAAAILPLVAKRVDFLLQGLAGSGIGRYGAANGSDITLRPDGWIIPLHALHTMTGFEFHPQPKLDVYLYGGNEFYGRAAYLNPTNTTLPAGYGSPLVTNAYCDVEVVPTGGAACGAQNKDIYDATTGFWYRFLKGPFGTLQYGLQYEYLHRSSWSGIGGAPVGIDNVAFSSIRYYLP